MQIRLFYSITFGTKLNLFIIPEIWPHTPLSYVGSFSFPGLPRLSPVSEPPHHLVSCRPFFSPCHYSSHVSCSVTSLERFSLTTHCTIVSLTLYCYILFSFSVYVCHCMIFRSNTSHCLLLVKCGHSWHPL